MRVILLYSNGCARPRRLGGTVVVTRRDALSAGSGLGQWRAGFGAALRSELTKIRTIRSTYWTLVAR